MKAHRLSIPEVILFEPKIFGDDRGFFLESFNQKVFDELVGHAVQFVQDNHSRSSTGVLRGLHYQIDNPQGKLVRVTSGSVLDVAVDMRSSSPTIGKWVSALLTAENHNQLWIPEGFAHGFFVLSEFADFMYKTTDYYSPEFERSVKWDDPDLAIDWRLSDIMAVRPILSAKDLSAPSFQDAEKFS
jgi:dTDP-4-dehydrorhamnose 3,5-epimerase